MERKYGQMDQKTKIKKAKGLINAKKELIWHVFDDAINVLVSQNDMIETTARDCIVGYLIDQLEYNNLLTDKAFILCKEKK